MIDADWHKRALVEGHLSHWLSVYQSENGFLLQTVTRTWQPRPDTVDLTAQSRGVYVLLSGYEVTGDARYLEAGRRGADFLLRYFSDPVHGGFFRVVDSGGRVVNATKHTYGHAFAIFALAHAFRITKHEQYRDAAIAAWQVVRAKLRDVGGGFRAEAPREFSGIGGLRTQNPVMHMFEALLALYKATGSHEALEGARSTGDFVINKLLRGTIDGGAYIPEWYDSNWQPLPTRQAGGYVELGHQFEWAYLLDVAAYQGLPATYAAVADRVLTYAIKTGYDDTSGGAFSVAYPEGSEVVRDKGWWQQSECLRALMRFGVLYGKRDMQRRYQQTLDFVREEFVDNTNGGWRIKPKSVCSSSQCTDEQPGAYHMTAMHMEALMLSSSKAQATP